jgi:hypothetical protein
MAIPTKGALNEVLARIEQKQWVWGQSAPSSVSDETPAVLPSR